MTESLPGPALTRSRTARGVGMFVLFGIIAFGTALRWQQIHESLWLDELHTAWCTLGDWGEVRPRSWMGNQSPLYFWLIKLGTTVLGPSEATLRAPSLVAGLLLIVVTADLVRRTTGSNTAGLWTALLVALDRHLIFFAQEARAYAIVQCLAWSHAAVTWQLTRTPTWRWRLAFIVGGVLLVYLHYTSALFLAGECAFLLTWSVWSNRRSAADSTARGTRAGYSPWQLCGDCLLMAAACLPAVPHVEYVAAHRAGWRHVVPPPSWPGLLGIFRWPVYAWIPVLAVGWHLAGASRAARRHTLSPRTCLGPVSRAGGYSAWCWLVAAAVFVPTLLAWTASTTEIASLFFRRYLASAAVGPILATPLAAWTFRSVWARHASCLVVTILSVATSGMLATWRTEGRLLADRQQDWRGAVAFINSQPRNGGQRVTWVRSGFLEADRLRGPHNQLLVAFCLAPVHSLYELGGEAVPLPNTPPEVHVSWTQEPTAETLDRWWIVNGPVEIRRAWEAAVRRALSAASLPQTITHRAVFGTVLVMGVQSPRSVPRGAAQPTSASSITSP